VTSLRYHLLDVFTAEPYRGNPLAVFVDPPALTDVQMQRIAGELNLSETVFTWSPATPDEPWPTRIFTPASEIPFAGHPTVGAAFLLASLGLAADPANGGELTLDEQVGTVAVTVTRDEHGRPDEAWLTVPRTSVPVGCAAAGPAAAALGLSEQDLHAGLPVEGWSAGVPFTVVPVADVGALGRARVDMARWEQDVATTDASHLYVVTSTGARRWQVRMFAPAMGITEDPATGAAAAAFSGYLLAHASDEDAARWLIDQGIEMGRASLLMLDIDRRGDEPSVVRIGGTSVHLGEGQVAMPPA
jgi:trans-2,3-dihydro-3-hydroxyanthranilate isomerase